jgi:hypothetical protein
MKSLFLFELIAVLAGCAVRIPERFDARRIDRTDGISRKEAALIAQTYVLSGNPDNRADLGRLDTTKADVSTFSEDPAYWVVTFHYEGFLNPEGYSVTVDRATGQIRSHHPFNERPPKKPKARPKQ